MVCHMALLQVLLAGGAVSSPQVLMLSGVGPADHLKSKVRGDTLLRILVDYMF